MLTFELRQIADSAAGTYFIVHDNSPVQNIEFFSNLRVAPIVSPIGPTNQLLIFEEGDTRGFTEVFGKGNRKQERMGNFSHNACLEMLKAGPLAVINLRNYTSEDKVEVATENILVGPKAPKVTAPYMDIVYENGFWTVQPKRMNRIAAVEGLNFTNTNSKSVSYFVVKADWEDIDGLTGEYDETLHDMEVDVDEFPALKPETIFGDTFVTVYVFNNNFADANTNPYYGYLFENGKLSIKNLKKLSREKFSGFAQKVTGTLIPFVKSEFGNDLSIDARLNTKSIQTGLSCIINPELFEQEYDYDIFNMESLFNGLVEKLNTNETTDELEHEDGDKLKLLSYDFSAEAIKDFVGIKNYNRKLYTDLNPVGAELTRLELEEESVKSDKPINITDFIEANDIKTMYNGTTKHCIVGGELHANFLLRKSLALMVAKNEKLGDANILFKVKAKEIENGVQELAEFTAETLFEETSKAGLTLEEKIELLNLNSQLAIEESGVTFNNPSDNKLGTDISTYRKLIEDEIVFDDVEFKTPVDIRFNITSTMADGTVKRFVKQRQISLTPENDREVFYLNGDETKPFNEVKVLVEQKTKYTTWLPAALCTVSVDGDGKVTGSLTTPITVDAIKTYEPKTRLVRVASFVMEDVDVDVVFDAVADASIADYGLKLLAVNDHKFESLKVEGRTVEGLKIRDEQLYNGSSSRQSELLDVLISPSIIKGFKKMRNIRYFVDVFKSFIEAGYKYQFHSLVKQLDECNIFVRAICNEPFIQDFVDSTNPSFKDAVGDTRSLKLEKYLLTGGNEQVSSKYLSKTKEGSEMVYFFGSEETDGYNVFPIAPKISNAFINKPYPWSVVANSTGRLSGIDNIALNPDEKERLAMEKFGWNPIIKKRNGFAIYGDYTAQNAFKRRKALSFISNSELLMYIKNELYNMSLDENFKKGRYEDYVKFETMVTEFMEGLALQRAIKPGPKVQCDLENNTDDIQSVGIKLVNIEYVNFRTLDKVVFAIDLS